MQGLQVKGVREGGVSQTGKPLKRAEVVHGLQVRDVREGGVSQTGKPLKRAEVVQGLQVRDVREGGVSQTGKCPKIAGVAHGLQVKGIREVSVTPHPFPFLSYFPIPRHKLIQRNFSGRRIGGRILWRIHTGKSCGRATV